MLLEFPYLQYLVNLTHSVFELNEHDSAILIQAEMALSEGCYNAVEVNWLFKNEVYVGNLIN